MLLYGRVQSVLRLHMDLSECTQSVRLFSFGTFTVFYIFIFCIAAAVAHSWWHQFSFLLQIWIQASFSCPPHHFSKGQRCPPPVIMALSWNHVIPLVGYNIKTSDCRMQTCGYKLQICFKNEINLLLIVTQATWSVAVCCHILPLRTSSMESKWKQSPFCFLLIASHHLANYWLTTHVDMKNWVSILKNIGWWDG